MDWRPPPLARDKRSNPPGFIIPCQPTLVHEVPADPRWIHEIKHDGYRMICRKDGGRIRIWSRQAVAWTEGLPGIAAALRLLPCSSCVLDGEAVVQREDGTEDFYALRSRESARNAILIAFDILEINGRDLRPVPLMERKGELWRLLTAGAGAIAAADYLESGGDVLFKHACEMGLEGVVSKRRDSPYRCGRAVLWQKVKCAGYERR